MIVKSPQESQNSVVETERINHPAHYNNGEIECIDAMIAAFGKEAVINFCCLNSFKYLWRAGKKTSDPVKDWKKSEWYTNKAIELKGTE